MEQLEIQKKPRKLTGISSTNLTLKTIQPTCKTLAKIKPNLELVATGEVTLQSALLSDSNTAGAPCNASLVRTRKGNADCRGKT